ncbi:MAG: 1-(5-phosphoribosyl)-5-[(5-phosphoribosylamino)methylideneamino]imidazole-4-carboxamide isomerase [Atribacterota bacterium]|nr:1-(5-phosphoribosyl)-5-[(5-phosphoribosylamino)methylideneamino]imidazole-4-carboxamide isomerase [Atribacterota bacterium]
MGDEIFGKLGEKFILMILPIPAIDIIEGKVVRLEKGDYQRVTVFSDAPSVVAKQWEAEGAPMLHVVDLEGARQGRPVNFETIQKIMQTVRIPVQVGGGIRTTETLRRYIEEGAQRVVLGSIAIKDPQEFEKMISIAASRIVVSLDVENGNLKIQGWTENTLIRAAHFAHELRRMGIQHFIFTDTTQDGTLSGIRPQVIREFLRESGVSIILAGGISGIEDIKKVRTIEGVEGVILGKALYTSTLSLKDAIKILQGE